MAKRTLEHDGKFWEAWVDGKTVYTRFGKFGAKGQTKLKQLATPAEAKVELEKQLAAKVKEGFAEGGAPQGNAALEAAILADPDDAQAYSVYGDWLQSQGDPRGELIALQQAKKIKPAAALLKQHEDYFLGPLAARAESFTWVNGFIREARLAVDEDEDLLAQLLAHPSGRFLVELSLVPFDEMDELFAVLAKHARPALHKLTIYDEETEVCHVDVGSLAKVWKALPNLALFWINTSGFTLGTIDAPALTTLQLGCDGLGVANVKSVAKLRAPKLERLEIEFGEPDRGGNATASDVVPLLGRKDLPKLKHLGLDKAPFADELVALLAGSPLLPKLETLSIAQGAMSDEGAAVFAEHATAFRHLKKLDVWDNYLTAAGVKLVEKLVKIVTCKPQKRDNGDDRYVGSWE